MPALTKPDFAKLNDHFFDVLMITQLKCGAEDPQMDAAHQYLRPLQVDTQCNCSVQGTLARINVESEYLLWYERLNIADMMGYRLGPGRPQTLTRKKRDYFAADPGNHKYKTYSRDSLRQSISRCCFWVTFRESFKKEDGIK